MKKKATELASHGYRTLLPDLYPPIYNLGSPPPPSSKRPMSL
jgi:hypothetical protein